MSDRVNHCPFLNRADSRCSNHFSLDRLESAFDHCFGQYKSCPSYNEMLAERRERRSDEHAGMTESTEVDVPAPAVYSTVSCKTQAAPAHVAYVQVRVPVGYVHQTA